MFTDFSQRLAESFIDSRRANLGIKVESRIVKYTQAREIQLTFQVFIRRQNIPTSHSARWKQDLLGVRESGTKICVYSPYLSTGSSQHISLKRQFF